MDGRFDVRGDSFAEVCNKVRGKIPEGYELIDCSIRLVNRKYVATFELKQSLVNKIKALKAEYDSTRRNPTMNGYLLAEIIRELEK